MTEEQVAEAKGTTQTVVAHLESGKVLPSARTLARFAGQPAPDFASALNHIMSLLH